MGEGKIKFSKSKLRRELRTATGMHVSDGAGAELLLVYEAYFKTLAEESAANAKHAGRKTITESDVRKAVETLRRVTSHGGNGLVA